MWKNLFGKATTTKRDHDKIWQSRDEAFKDLLAFITSLDRVKTRVLLFAQFMDTFRILEEQLTTQQITYRTYTTVFEGHRLNTLAEYHSTESVLLVHAPVLPDSSMTLSDPAGPWDLNVHVLIAEHHPLVSYDDHILNFAQQLPCRTRIGFYEALDGALLSRYGGMRISKLMTALKSPDNECVSSHMLDSIIRQAQEKISQQVKNPVLADTAEQWFQYNLPSLK